jgi:hypothetical protein
MALYNSEAINGFPTGNLSLTLLNNINPEQIHFVRNLLFYLINFILFIKDTLQRI